MSNNDIFNTLDQIFSEKQLSHSRKQLKNKNTTGAPSKDLEVALAVLLVDLACCDQTFNPKEYAVISNGLRRLFGSNNEQVSLLVNQAKGILADLRGTQQFADKIKKELSHEDKLIVLEIINEVIAADGQEDGFEVYLREKFKTLLGV
jgi:uncharacterized tellurite resistance protein B-like protein